MSAAITGNRSHANQTHEGHSHVQPPDRDDAGESQASSPLHELTPDRPPQRAEAAESNGKRPRGFAAMDRKLVSEIARKGGKAAHSAGTAHEFTSEEARVAGRKGGRATHAKRRKTTETGSPPSEPREAQ